MKLEIEITKTSDKLPQTGLNVMVNYEVEYNDYWSRGYLLNDKWYIMSFNGTKLLNINQVKEWFYLPKK